MGVSDFVQMAEHIILIPGSRIERASFYFTGSDFACIFLYLDQPSEPVFGSPLSVTISIDTNRGPFLEAGKHKGLIRIVYPQGPADEIVNKCCVKSAVAFKMRQRGLFNDADVIIFG